jgi:hypothetical protein
MARTYNRDDETFDSAPKVSGQTARQGQNIKGMVTVLVVSLLLVGVAYAAMLALTQQEQTPTAPASVTETAPPAPQQNPNGTMP